MLLATPALADPRAAVRGDLDDDLRERIVEAIGETDDPPDNRAQARRRAVAAAEDAVAVLRSEGYYASVVEEDVEGEDPPLAVVTVTPGPRFTIISPTVEWLETPPEPSVARSASLALELEDGAPGRAADVVAAEGRVIARLQALGYPDAVTGDRRVVVDHRTRTLEPTYRVDSGGIVRLDGVRVRTLGRTNPAWVQRLAPWTPGQRYVPETVAELERRLTETGVYETVAVALAPEDQTTEAGLRPVIVTLSDQPSRVLEAGVGYSTSEGIGLDAIWTWRNRFGRADTLRFQARLAEIDSRLGVDLSMPHWRRAGRTLTLSAAVVNEETDAYDRTALSLRAGVSQRLGRNSFLTAGAWLDTGRYDEQRFTSLSALPVSISRDLTILTGQAGANLDFSNDPLDPTTGWRFNIDVQPTLVTGDSASAFLRLQTQLTGYLPLADEGTTVVAGRVRLGSIVGGDLEDIPSDRRFYSGGGGSVRGYDFQGVGPRLPNNVPVGGVSLFETSVEVRRQIRGSLGAAVFVDGGTVGSDTVPDLTEMRWAVGAGVRYDLPFGPVRADVAVPIDPRPGDPSFQIYISIGQAF